MIDPWMKYRAVEAKIEKMLKYDPRLKRIKVSKDDYAIMRGELSNIDKLIYKDYVPYRDDIQVYCEGEK